jgi:hypothetical protein
MMLCARHAEAKQRDSALLPPARLKGMRYE